MRPGRADRLSRVLVGCHPRRWRERYGEEILDVLDQHHPTARTVASLAASALSTHLDPGYRTERLSPSRLRHVARMAAAVVAGLVVAGGMLGFAAWRERWQLSDAGGVGGVAFASSQRLLVSAVGGASQNSMDTMWDITDPARPRQLSAFQGGEPTALSPDGRIVATVSYDGEPALWNVADPRRPARTAIMATGGNAPLWGEAFSPDGRVLAVAYTDRIFLWDVASTTRPRLLGTLAAPVRSVGNASFITPQNITFSSDGRILASVTGTGQITVWNVTDPGRAVRLATLSDSSDYVEAVAVSPGGTLVVGVTYYGTVLVYSLADPARPARTASINDIMAHALYPDDLLQHPDAPPCPSCSPANYAAAFTPDGRSLTVVVARQEGNVTASAFTIATRDTVFTWNVTGSGTVSGLAIATRNVNDSQPTLAPDGRTVADGSPTSNAVYLWTPSPRY